MKLMLLLGIHALLMLFYAIAVENGYSRMHWLHLLLALMLPYIGEICLLIAELNYIPSKPVYVSPLNKEATSEKPSEGLRLPSDWQERIHGNEEEARVFLLKMISGQCEDLVCLLHEALHAQSSEVCHIAAITLMKLRNQYEKAIIASQKQLECHGSNILSLKAVIDSIDAYRTSGLNEGELLRNIEQEEIDYIERYLSIRQADTEYRQTLIALLIHKNPIQALEQSRLQLELAPESINSWEWALTACQTAGMNDQLKNLLQGMRFSSAFHSPDGVKKLKELECRYAQKT